MIIKVLGLSPTLDTPPNGPKHDTRSNGPKDGVAAPWQILDADLFRRFPLILKGFRCETTCIGFLIKLAFQPYMDHRKWGPDASWVTSLRQTGPRGRGRLKIMLDQTFGSCWTSLLVIIASTSSSKFLMTLSNVSNQDNIIR